MVFPAPGTNDAYTEALRAQAIGQTLAATIVAATAVTTLANVGGPEYTYILSGGSASITSWTITGPTDDQEIWIKLYRSGTQAVTWPTNFRWHANTAPVLGGAATWNFICMEYQAAGGLWLQKGMPSLGVPGV